MRYFELQKSVDEPYIPRLEAWYGKFDLRNIRIDRFHKLPQRELFTVKHSEEMLFADIIITPFLLLSQKVVDVIHMYREICFCKDIILLDQVSGKSELYNLPVLDETTQLVVQDRGENLSGDAVDVDKHIFWVTDSYTRHTIISLDLAESLIKRDVTGFGIKEVEILL